MYCNECLPEHNQDLHPLPYFPILISCRAQPCGLLNRSIHLFLPLVFSNHSPHSFWVRGHNIPLPQLSSSSKARPLTFLKPFFLKIPKGKKNKLGIITNLYNLSSSLRPPCKWEWGGGSRGMALLKLVQHIWWPHGLVTNCLRP